jgi:hypothetical protein
MNLLTRFFTLSILALALLAPLADAKPALVPAEAPVRFFKALEAMDFAEAWQSLTAQSQAQMVETVIATEKDPKLTPVLVRQLFESNDKTLQMGFWASFRYHLGVADWLKQKFELEKSISSEESQVKAMPSKLILVVRNEKGDWKFGFAESFMPAKKVTPTAITKEKP